MKRIFFIALFLSAVFAADAQIWTQNNTRLQFGNDIRLDKSVRLPREFSSLSDTGLIVFKWGRIWVKDSTGAYVAMAKLSEAGGGGSGTDNTNADAGGLRLIKSPSQVVKELFAAFGLLGDSTSNSDGITFKVDSAVISTKAYVDYKSDILNAAKADKSLTFSNGYGLTGFGNLSANRTPALDTAIGSGAFSWPRWLKIRDSLTSIGVSDNIYKTNGTFTGNRVASLGGNTLKFEGTTTEDYALFSPKAYKGKASFTDYDHEIEIHANWIRLNRSAKNAGVNSGIVNIDNDAVSLTASNSTNPDISTVVVSPTAITITADDGELYAPNLTQGQGVYALRYDAGAGKITYADTTTGGSGGVSDGDKGDVVVSASGATWKVPDLKKGFFASKYDQGELNISTATWSRKSTSVYSAWRDGSILWESREGDTLFNAFGWQTGGTVFDSVYYSVDGGDTWTGIYKMPFAGHTITFDVNPDGYIYIMGGDYLSTMTVRRSVYRSNTNFRTYELMTNSAPWNSILAAAYHDDKGNIYRAGGQRSLSAGTGSDTIYVSYDQGANWSVQAGGLTHLAKNIYGHVKPFAGRIVLVAGGVYDGSSPTYLKTVYSWHVDDPKNNVQHDTIPLSTGRQYASVEVWDGKLWFISGNDAVGNTNDVLFMNKSFQWSRYYNYEGINLSSTLSTTHAAPAAVHRDKLYRGPGNTNNDVYVLERSRFMDSLHIRNNFGVNDYTYLSEIRNSNGTFLGNNLHRGLTDNTITRVSGTDNGTGYIQDFQRGHLWLGAVNSTPGTDVSDTTGNIMNLKPDGELIISDNLLYDAGNYKLQVYGNLHATGSVNFPFYGGSTNRVSYYTTSGDLEAATNIFTDGSKIGLGSAVATPTTNLDSYIGNTATLTDVTQGLTKFQAGIASNYDISGGGTYTGGIGWFTVNNNATKPKAGVFSQNTGAGSLIHIGVSDDYGVGITKYFSFNPAGYVLTNNLADTLATMAYARSVGGGGGSGTDNANVGTGFPLVNQADQTVKKLGEGYALDMDTTITANTVTLKVDSSIIANKNFVRGDTLQNPCSWLVIKDPENPQFSIAKAQSSSEISQYIPTKVKISKDTSIAIVKGDTNNSLYGYYSFNGEKDWVFVGPVLQPGSLGAWDDFLTLDPLLRFDSANHTIHLFYKGGTIAGDHGYGIGHATSTRAAPLTFTKDAGNPIWTNANIESQLGIGNTLTDVSISNILISGGTYYWHGTYLQSGQPYKLFYGTSSSFTNPAGATHLLSPSGSYNLVQQPSIIKNPDGSGYFMLYTEGWQSFDSVRFIKAAWTGASTPTSFSTWDCFVFYPVTGSSWENRWGYAGQFPVLNNGNYDQPVIVNGGIQFVYSGLKDGLDGQGGFAYLYRADQEQEATDYLTSISNTHAPAEGSTNYIQNQTSNDQTANFHISGHGKSLEYFWGDSILVGAYGKFTSITNGIDVWNRNNGAAAVKMGAWTNSSSNYTSLSVYRPGFSTADADDIQMGASNSTLTGRLKSGTNLTEGLDLEATAGSINFIAPNGARYSKAASATFSTYTNSLTGNTFIVNAPSYVENGLIPMLSTGTTDNNGTKPKSLIGTELTGSGTKIRFFVANSFATGADQNTFTITVDGAETVNDAYNATTWNGNNEIPTKDALRDKIESLVLGSGGTPGGSDGNIQYNDGGSFGGFGSYDDANGAVLLNGRTYTSGQGKLQTTGAISLSGTGFSGDGAASIFLTNTTATQTYVINTSNGAEFQVADMTAGGATRFLINNSGTARFYGALQSGSGATPEFQVTTAGLITKYGGANPSHGQILIGNGTTSMFEAGTLSSGDGSITISNSAGVIDLSVTSPGGGSGHTIKEEGTPLTNRAGLNFVGAGITAADDAGNNETDVTLDATLNALAAYNTNGILVQTSADNFTGRTITGTTNKITVSNGDGVSGNPTLNVGSDIVDETIANTYAEGMKQTFSPSGTTAGMNLGIASEDPSSLAEADLWYSTGSVRYRDGAATRTLVTENGSQTLSNKTIAIGSNTVSGSISDFNAALTGADFATLEGSETFTNKRITKRSSTLSASATPTINADNTDYVLFNMSTTDVTSMSTNFTVGTPTEGQILTIVFVPSGTRSITWGTSFEASTVALPTSISSRTGTQFLWNSTTSKFTIIGVW